MSKIYVASSWRNTYQPVVVEAFRRDGHEVYDFRHPEPGNDGFSWREISPEWETWSPEEYRRALAHPVAWRGFLLDFEGMNWADQFCLVLPCGRSAHLEAGWALGARKPTSIYIPERIEPELMYLLSGIPCLTLGEVLAYHRAGPHAAVTAEKARIAELELEVQRLLAAGQKLELSIDDEASPPRHYFAEREELLQLRELKAALMEREAAVRAYDDAPRATESSQVVDRMAAAERRVEAAAAALGMGGGS